MARLFLGSSDEEEGLNSKNTKLYGEIPESEVDPEKVRLANKALDLLVKIYKTDRPRLRWIKLSEYEFKVNRALEALKKLAGEQCPVSERSYYESSTVDLGVVRRALTHWATKSIYINADCYDFLIVSTIAHEFYHWSHPYDLSEENADRFARWFEELFKRHQD